MKLSVPFLLNNEEYNIKADEYNIIYDDDSTAEKLDTFLETYQEKRINILFNISNYNKIIDIISSVKHDNFAIMTADFVEDYLVEKIKECGWSYYVARPASNFYELEYYIQKGVSDIFLADDLWHNLPRVKDKCGNTNIRMVADSSNSLGKKYTKDSEAYYTMFIPRPEDFDLLSQYVDVIQFLSTKENYLKVLYKTWFINRQWIGNIREIVYADIIDLPNINIQSDYTESKISCGARCLYDTRCKCRKCRHSYELAKSLSDKGLEMRRK